MQALISHAVAVRLSLAPTWCSVADHADPSVNTRGPESQESVGVDCVCAWRESGVMLADFAVRLSLAPTWCSTADHADPPVNTRVSGVFEQKEHDSFCLITSTHLSATTLAFLKNTMRLRAFVNANK
ncbi:hypothetical protein PoB_006612300 [Plakobranchus ocellatus]|uniref:Secreted protein n=1 Tax=Plakobranchus ocellatus TaxID=259542 RepID=A0AAV4D637_9GAST|nr:hypothetical protein PoB_006612300 [Plakobranchus ocellatus]